MKRSFVFGERTGLQLGWGLALALLVVVYGAIVVPSEQGVRARALQARELYDLANRNERMLENAKGLRAARERVNQDLKRLSGEATPGRASLAALHLLQREAETRHIVVSGFGPEQSAADADGVQEVTISMRGTYEAVLRAVADLSKRDVLIEIEGVDLKGDGAVSGAGEIDAVVHATLYHGAASVMKVRERATTIAR